MQNEDLIQAGEFCMHHHIELSFIQSLKDYDLIETVMVDEKIFFPASQLPRIEKIMRLHFDLDINFEGIETIAHLLDRMEEMQNRISHLTSLLKVYERRDQA